jgi:beta-N-acetylglucosaminidase
MTRYLAVLLLLLPVANAQENPVAEAMAKFSVDTDLTQPVDITAEDFEAYFKQKGAKGMLGTGEAFVAAQEKYGINAVYIMAHAAWESGWGKSWISKNKKNMFGYGAYDRSPAKSAWTFETYTDGVDIVMSKVKEDYLTPGGKYWGGAPSLRGMNKAYATDKNWQFGITSIMNRYRDFDRKQTHDGKDSPALKASVKLAPSELLWVPIPKPRSHGVDTLPR